ncbi:radical SAM additional 4Fe4S-binding SPASM domain-containing protein [Desulfofundulus australicus DSM 11792]|uniref:Radical SAM additional 4Fe4S-binding SPASM domain-containing protein n=1 Tax=Desulfofundulus australicus DSM 11792 TaxID=1121425 RepID=A0A1M5A6Z9_9FIRM|nr:SPASM domain-containing protein [Desulfofundulus australicus]SHF26049.1 radical SAM additional 4Fe4S-binding SPASM domain-containing protein [Desulfofundulus australicus DSM 11792]
MTWEVARQAVDYAAARSRSFKIQFSDGEPLLNLPLVREVVAYVRSRRLSVKLQLQTNGTQTAIKRAEEIARLGGPLIRFREVERLKYQLCRSVARQHYCYATTGQSLAVAPDGSVYPCASLCGLTEFYLGRITDGRFSLAEALAGTPLLGRTVERVPGCRDCPDRFLCGGGCPARAYAFTGRVDRACEADCLLRKVYLDFC